MCYIWSCTTQLHQAIQRNSFSRLFFFRPTQPPGPLSPAQLPGNNSRASKQMCFVDAFPRPAQPAWRAGPAHDNPPSGIREKVYETSPALTMTSWTVTWPTPLPDQPPGHWSQAKSVFWIPFLDWPSSHSSSPQNCHCTCKPARISTLIVASDLNLGGAQRCVGVGTVLWCSRACACFLLCGACMFDRVIVLPLAEGVLYKIKGNGVG